jgi:3-methyl-2-oxobutanoate hydroxymethyltransferase
MSPDLSVRKTAGDKAAGRRLAMLTAYDYPMARLLHEAGVDWILVGDSLGMVVLGYPDTTHVSLADMAHHTAAVARGSQTTPVIADLPYHSYETAEQTLLSAQTLMKAGAHAVKLEGGSERLPQVVALRQAGIPVMGHLGMLPQNILLEGTYRIKGRSEAEAERLLSDALALEAAGVFAIVLELVTPPVAERVTAALSIPTIGIGSGKTCDGQVRVTHDLIGAFPWFCPKFVTPLAATGEQIRAAASTWAREIRSPGIP